ncbi:AAA family ATPase, partial [Peribacillus simplex]|uniref:AAA family ATPase n=2 Tax=Bacillales TaxID=1385 RepID=UPI0011AA8F28
ERCVLIEGDLLLHMLHHELPLSWDERLSLTWKNLLALTRNMLRQGLNVVIDFVVEDELEWFCEQLSDLDVSIKYAVLHADKEKIAERLTTRGDIDSLE